MAYYLHAAATSPASLDGAVGFELIAQTWIDIHEIRKLLLRALTEEK